MDKFNSVERSIVLKRIIWSVGSVISILVLFFAILLILKQVLGIPFSLWINLWILIWLICLLAFLFFIKKRKEIKVVYRDHFALFILQILFLTVILHYIGGIESLGILFYTFFLVYGIFLLPPRYGATIVLLSLLFIAGLTFLEYNGILQHQNIFAVTELYRDLNYIVVRLILVFSIFSILSIVANRLAGEMRKKSEEVIKAQAVSTKLNIELQEKVNELEQIKNDLEETKATLEIKVRARTKELEELTDRLEDEVRNRTKELRNKVEELEKFQKFAVGREMKMVELKEKISRLKYNKTEKK